MPEGSWRQDLAHPEAEAVLELGRLLLRLDAQVDVRVADWPDLTGSPPLDGRVETCVVQVAESLALLQVLDDVLDDVGTTTLEGGSRAQALFWESVDEALQALSDWSPTTE